MANFNIENTFWRQGIQHIAGVDEAGRGPLAGPVVAGAVILLPDQKISKQLKGLDDSKRLKERDRDYFFHLIQEVAVDYSIGIVSHQVIDRINILQATFLAMRRALNGLIRVDHVLVDGNRPIPHWHTPQQAIVSGDSLSLSIAAASVLAKVVRDRIMVTLDHHYPGYGFARHKGYPTQIHRERLQEVGLSPLHRHTFCRKILA